MRKTLFYNFAISLISDWIESSCVLLSVSAFDLLQYVVFIKVCEENEFIQIVQKERGVLIAFQKIVDIHLSYYTKTLS